MAIQFKKHNRIFSLGEERVTVVNNLLARGESSIQVARLIQGKWGQCQDVSEKTLIQQILRYKDDTASGKIPVAVITPEGDAVTQMLSKVDVVAEYASLIALQKTRLAMFLEKEKQSKLPIAGVSKDVELLSALLRDTQKIQFDLGVDAYNGPQLQGGRVASRTQSLPDGTVVREEVTEAYSVAQNVLENFRKGRDRPAIEGELVNAPGS